MKRGIILEESELREATEYFLSKDKFVFDIESYGEHRGVPHLAPISWISLAADGAGIVIPMGHPNGSKIIGEKEGLTKYKTGVKKGELKKIMVPVFDEPPPQLSTGTVFEILRPLFFNETIRKIGHGSISDLTAVTKYFGGIPLPPYGDTLIKQYLLNENLPERELGLKTITKRNLGVTYDEEGVGKCVENFGFDIVAYYSYCDSVYTYVLDEKLEPLLIEEGLEAVYDLEMGVLGALIKMKLHGANMDVPKIHELEKILKAEVIEKEAAVYKAAGKRFNINSNPQKQSLLYGPKPDGQGLKPWKLTDGGKKKEKLGQKPTIKDYSTDDDVLASYPLNTVASSLREYSDVNKLLTTYVYGWLGDGELKESKIYNGHIHADFLQHGTVTGRFSCRSPNLQNIPRPYTEHGKLLRDIFIPEENSLLVVADYAQIELVVLAHYLEQGKLFEGFLAGIDPHTMTAAMVLDKDPADVTKVERQDLGKTLGFAVVFGAGLNKVASMAKISVAEAKQVLKKHERMFPEIHDFKKEVIRITKSRKPEPYLTTLMGRKRRVNYLFSSNEGLRMGAERQAFNSLIQGGAADLIKYSMLRVDKMLPPEIQLVMTVHDELVLNSPEHLAQEAADILKEAMTGSGIQELVKVPLNVDVHIVQRWADAK